MQKQEMAAAEATGDSVFNVAPLLLSGTQVIPRKLWQTLRAKALAETGIALPITSLTQPL